MLASKHAHTQAENARQSAAGETIAGGGRPSPRASRNHEEPHRPRPIRARLQRSATRPAASPAGATTRRTIWRVSPPRPSTSSSCCEAVATGYPGCSTHLPNRAAAALTRSRWAVMAEPRDRRPKAGWTSGTCGSSKHVGTRRRACRDQSAWCSLFNKVRYTSRANLGLAVATSCKVWYSPIWRASVVPAQRSRGGLLRRWRWRSILGGWPTRGELVGCRRDLSPRSGQRGDCWPVPRLLLRD